MKIKKQTIFRFLVIVYMLSVLWWMFGFPYDAGLLYAPVPDNSVFISEHNHLSGRLDEIMEHPIAMKAMKEFGVDFETVSEWTDQLKFLAGRKTVLALSEEMMGINGPVCIISSWIGSKSILARAFLLFSGNRGFRKAAGENGIPVWVQEGRGEGGKNVSFALHNGVAVICLSRDPAGIFRVVRHMVPRINRDVPFMSHLLNERTGINDVRQKRKHYSDVFSAQWMVSGRSRREFVSLCTDLGKDDVIEGELRSSLNVSAGAGKIGSDEIVQISSILGGREDGILVVPTDILSDIMTWFNCPSRTVLMINRIRAMAVDGGSFFLAMFGGERAGKVYDMPAPSIVAGTKLRKPDNWIEQVQDLVDDINARLGTSFILCRRITDDIELVAVESASAENFQMFIKGEGLAFGLIDGYLLFATSEKVLFEMCSSNAKKTEKELSWPSSVRVSGTSSLAWVDLGEDGERVSFGQTLKDGLNVWKLAVSVQAQTPELVRIRKNLDFAEDVLDAIRPARTITFDLDSSCGFLCGPFVIGASSVGKR